MRSLFAAFIPKFSPVFPSDRLKIHLSRKFEDAFACGAGLFHVAFSLHGDEPSDRFSSPCDDDFLASFSAIYEKYQTACKPGSVWRGPQANRT